MIPCSRFRGCLLAALAGDCFGAHFEFSQRRSKFQTVWSKLESHLRHAGASQLDYTDDTALSRAVCDSLIAHNGLVEPAHMARTLTEAYFERPDRGYGAAIGDVFVALRDTNYARPFGPAAAQFNGSGSYGNGGAMRAAPLGLAGAGHSQEAVANQLVDQATRLTHSNPLALAGARLQATAVRLALRSDGADAAWLCEALSAEAAGVDRHYNLGAGRESFSKSMSLVKQLLAEHYQPAAVDEEAVKVAELLGTDVTALRSVPTAIYCALRSLRPSHQVHSLVNNVNSGSLRLTCDQMKLLDCLTFAVCLGGDTDTIASMACAIVGAALGFEALPAALLLACEVSDSIDCTATRLHRTVYSS